MDNLDDFIMTRPPTANRPLLGLTVLVVENSRFACEAMRLLCLRSGARIRRADNLHHAHQHLKVYRPSVVIVDLGLPDGPGETLLEQLDRATPRVDVLLGTSGDADGAQRALAAGADGFLEKPVQSLAEFQQTILCHLPPERQPMGPRPLHEEFIRPDPVAFRDDLAHVVTVLSGTESDMHLDYLTQFLGGVARSASDKILSAAVDSLSDVRRNGGPVRPEIAKLAAVVQNRLNAVPPL